MHRIMVRPLQETTRLRQVAPAVRVNRNAVYSVATDPLGICAIGILPVGKNLVTRGGAAR